MAVLPVDSKCAIAPVDVAILHRTAAGRQIRFNMVAMSLNGLMFEIRFFSPWQEEAAEKTKQRNQKCYPENNRYA